MKVKTMQKILTEIKACYLDGASCIDNDEYLEIVELESNFKEMDFEDGEDFDIDYHNEYRNFR